MRNAGRGCASVGVCMVTGLLLVSSWTPVSAQHPQYNTDYVPRTLRPFGQPVIPSFEGWAQNPDGSYDLCFGYFNGNTQEALDLPLGPDNFIQPEEFDGDQPTHFDPVPYSGYRRYYCVFTVTVPEDFGDERVVWTLRVRGQAYSTGGHLTASAYNMAQGEVPERKMVRDRRYREAMAEGREEDMLSLSGAPAGAVAPLLRFVKPAGPEGRGVRGNTVGPVTVRAGDPFTLTLAVRDPDGKMATSWWVGWSKHQGPGQVTFTQKEMEADPTTGYEATTTVTFSEPGNYVVRVQSIENIRSFGRGCCWTNGYVQVTVTP